MDLVTALALELDSQAPDVVSFVGGGGKTSALFRLASEITASNRRVVATTTTRLSSHEITATHSVVEVDNQRLPVDGIARALDVHGQCMLVGAPGTPAGVSDLEGLKRTGLRPEQVDDLESTRMAREIAKNIEETMQYPGQIKVTVIRETRAIEFAK